DPRRASSSRWSRRLPRARPPRRGSRVALRRVRTIQRTARPPHLKWASDVSWDDDGVAWFEVEGRGRAERAPVVKANAFLAPRGDTSKDQDFSAIGKLGEPAGHGNGLQHGEPATEREDARVSDLTED